MVKLRISREFNPREVLSSFTIALILSAQYWVTIAESYLNLGGGTFTFIMTIILVLGIASFLGDPVAVVSRKFFLLLALVLTAYLLTCIFAGKRSNLLLTDFIGFCLLPIICGGMIRPDYKKVLSYTMYFLCAGIPVFEKLFAKGNVGSAYDAVSMGTAYALLPVICAGIIHFLFYKKESTPIEKFLYVVNIIYIISFVLRSYRGALVSLIVTLMIGWLFSRQGKPIKKKTVMIGLAVLVLLTLFFANSRSIFSLITSFVSKHNIKIAFIDKMRFLAVGNDISHGRTEIWAVAFKKFLQRPIFGHGMATFQYYEGIVFPHNFILQFLYDGGIVLAVPLLYILVSELLRAVKSTRYSESEKFVFIILIAGTSIPRALVSAESWRLMIFWLLMGTLANQKRAKNLEKIGKGQILVDGETGFET
ncbi:MAG TPA: hypothetical protein DCR07_03300 [Lactococcus sp.]|nr:hypothetical protein [Lactococcus sp.]